jgi:hypothetical protein
VKRRLFLKGIAGASLAAPFLPSLMAPRKAYAAATGPQRLVIFFTNNGCLTNRWFPKVENGAIDAAALSGTTLQPLSDLAGKLLFPRGLAMFPRGTVNGYFDPHDQGMGSKLTCAPILPGETSGHWSTGPSLDWLAASLVNPGTKSPLVLSVGNAFANVKGIVSYKPGATAADPPTAYTPEANPKNVYTSLTGLFQTGGGVTPADYAALQGNSILDICKADVDALTNMNMSQHDARALADWKDLMRGTETKIVTTAACTKDNATALGITDTAITAASKRDTATAFTLGGDMMINLIALTMMCDANRMIILQWPGFVTFNNIPVTMPDGTTIMMAHTSDHHGLSHRNGSVAVGGTCAENVITNISQIDSFYAGKYSKLVHLINGIQEGGGSMLDNSMLMWLPELADGNAHNNNNLPIVIAGSGGGYLKQGASVNLDTKTLMTGNSEASCANGNTSVGFNTGSNTGSVPLNKLYVTLLNALGKNVPGFTPVDRFGVMDYTDSAGTPGIKNPGELTSLKA